MFVAIRIASQHAVESIDSKRNGVGTDLVIDFPTDIAQGKCHVTPLRRRIFQGRTVGRNEVRTLARTRWKQPSETHHSETVAIWKVRRTRSTEMDGAVNRLSLDNVADYAPIRDEDVSKASVQQSRIARLTRKARCNKFSAIFRIARPSQPLSGLPCQTLLPSV
jgi:hypothetical protein